MKSRTKPKNPSLNEFRSVIRSLLAEDAFSHDEPNPWDEKTVDIRDVGIEKGEEERVKKKGTLSKAAAAQSMIVKSWENQHWEQLLVAAKDRWWVIEMGDLGPVVQSTRLVREGRPYMLNDAKQLDQFENDYDLDMLPWPSNIMVLKKKLV